jgi:hypothetical protein
MIPSTRIATADTPFGRRFNVDDYVCGDNPNDHTTQPILIPTATDERCINFSFLHSTSQRPLRWKASLYVSCFSLDPVHHVQAWKLLFPQCTTSSSLTPVCFQELLLAFELPIRMTDFASPNNRVLWRFMFGSLGLRDLGWRLAISFNFTGLQVSTGG